MDIAVAFYLVKKKDNLGPTRTQAKGESSGYTLTDLGQVYETLSGLLQSDPSELEINWSTQNTHHMPSLLISRDHTRNSHSNAARWSSCSDAQARNP